jgi:hypothetical protein
MKKINLALIGVLALVAILILPYQTRAKKKPRPPAACTQTELLFSFVTNQTGFDTGLTIANTTEDPFGTPNVSGTCTLNFYDGTNAHPAYTTPTIPAGTVHTDLVSTRAPNFQGYIIAVCNFPKAKGGAFTTDVGARNIAWSDPVQVLDRGESCQDVN